MNALIQSLPDELISMIMLYTLESLHTDFEEGYLKYLLGAHIYNKLIHYGEIVIENGHIVRISMMPLAYTTRQDVTFNIEALQAFPYLKHFNLNNTRLCGDITSIKSIPSLTKFFIGNTKVSGNINDLQDCPNITHCYITNTQIIGNVCTFLEYRDKHGLNYCPVFLSSSI